VAEKKKLFHYGYVICAMCLLTIVCSTLFSGGLAIALSAVRKVYSLTGTQTSMLITIRSVTAFVAVIFMTQFYGGLGLRLGMVVGMIVGAVGMFLYSIAGTSMMMYYIASALGGVTYGLCMMLPATLLIKKWFRSNIVTALAVCSAGTGFSGVLFSPIQQIIIDGYGVPAVFQFEAVIFCITAVILFMFVRNSPEECGLEPVGGYDYQDSSSSGKKSVGNAHGIYLGNKSIMLMTLTIVGLGLAASPASAHLALCFNWAGLDPMDVAKATSLSGIALIVGKLTYGAIADRFGSNNAAALYTIIVCLGYVCVVGLLVYPQNIMMILGYLGWGIGGSVCTLAYPVWAMDFSSDEDYPKTLKKFQLAFQLGSMFGSPFPGIIADATGSYCYYYVVPIVFYSLMTIVGLVLSKRLAGMRRKAAISVD